MEFRKQGMTSIIISHKLNEVKKVADQITVIRDGTTVETLDAATEEVSEDRIIKGMVGRDMEDRYPPRDPRSARRFSRSRTGTSSTRTTATASSCTT
jgi:putative multiple sugar transport system ATP-binding protein